MLKTVLPFGNAKDVRNCAFTILSEEYPLKIIEISNLMRRRYGLSVTFQAVRKALMLLVQEGVLVKQGKEFMISKEWVMQNKKYLDDLYLKLCEGKRRGKTELQAGEVGVFTFDSINQMVRVWEDLSDIWFKNYKKGDYNVNCYQAAHSWEVLLHPDVEANLMGQAKKNGVRAYILCTENTPLDRSLVKFHRGIGVKMVINPSSSSFDKSYYIGTYGDLIIQAKYPPEIVKRLDSYFKKNRNIEKLDLAELSRIANAKTKIRMTVIKNLEMAKQINSSILAKIREVLSP